MRLTNDDKGILRRALSKHWHSLRRAVSQCAGDTWKNIYLNESDRTEKLLRRLLGKKEEILPMG